MLRRILAAVIIVLAAALVLVFAWPQLFGLEQTFVIAQVVALRGLAALCGLIALLAVVVLALAIRPFRRLAGVLVVLLLVFVGVNAAVIGSRGVAEKTVLGSASETSITVLAWNTLGGEASPHDVAALAIGDGADVLALPETTERFAIEVANLMKAEGRPMWVHVVSFDNDYRAKQTALLTSVELGTYAVDSSRGNTAVVPSVIAAPVDGIGPTLVAAHPVAPIPEYMQEWPDDLEFLARICAGDVIMAGDFNSTLDHWEGLSSGAGADFGECVDAAQEAGSAAVGTWPAALPAILASPIDHVVATAEWKATAFRVATEFDDSGSDHRPVVATLVRSD